MLSKESKVSEVTLERLKAYKFKTSAISNVLAYLEDADSEEMLDLKEELLEVIYYEFMAYESLILHTLDYSREIFKNDLEAEISLERVIADVYSYVGLDE